MGKFKAGMIGGGYWARSTHLPALAANDDVELVAICRRSRDALEAVAKDFNIPRTYTDYREMLRKEKLDAVFVLVSISVMLEIAGACLEAGIPTLLEKPPGKDADEARKLCEIADRTGTTNVVAFNRRHSPTVRRARELFTERGEPIRMASARMLRWRRDDEDFIRGTGIHAIDTLRYFAGDVVEVETAVAAASEKGGTNVISILKYASGAIGSLAIETMCGTVSEEYELHGCGLSMFIRTPQGGGSGLAGGFELWQGPTYNLASENSKASPTYVGPGMLSGIYDEEVELIDCIKEKRKSPNDVHDGLKTMLVAEAVAKGGHQVVEKP